MFTASTDLYDAIYSPMKNYPAEAEAIAGLLRELRPGVHSLLDVACGTAEHLGLLRREHGLEVDGVDIDDNMLALARAKVPDATFHKGDMRSFNLGRTYDAILCLFSSIGYVLTPEGLDAAFASFARHLSPGGVLVLEPWLTPEAFLPGRCFMNVVDGDEVKICRMSRSELDGRTSRIYFEYLIGDGRSIDHRSEVHALGLFTVEETLSALHRAGFAAEYRDESPWSKRGMYIGRREPAA